MVWRYAWYWDFRRELVAGREDMMVTVVVVVGSRV
jgi:hypothetical protein